MRADRLLSLMLLLQMRGKMTAQALAKELGVSRRTILRDIDALSVAGVPVYAEGGHGGGFALDENYRTSLTGLQEAEIRTLFVTRNTQLFSEVGLGEAAKSTRRKLLAGLPTSQLPSVAYIRQRLLIDPAWWWREAQPPAFWEQLQQAVYEDRWIRAVYETHTQVVSERMLAPYSLVAKSSVWYLVAWRDQEFRPYRVSRFHELELLDQHFQREPGFDLPTYWEAHLQEFADALPDYEFTLQVHPSRVSFLKSLVPGRCRFAMPSNEDNWVKVDIRLESLELAKMLVLGLGRQAQVLEPPELKQAVLEAAQDILAGP